MAAVSGQRLVPLTVKTLEGMRCEENFKNLFDTVAKKAQKHTRIGAPSLPRKRNPPDYCVFQYMEGYGQGAPADHPQTVGDHYRQIYFEAIDVVAASINDRFNQPSYRTFAALEMMLLSVIGDKPFEDGLQHLQPSTG